MTDKPRVIMVPMSPDLFRVVVSSASLCRAMASGDVAVVNAYSPTVARNHLLLSADEWNAFMEVCKKLTSAHADMQTTIVHGT